MLALQLIVRPTTIIQVVLLNYLYCLDEDKFKRAVNNKTQMPHILYIFIYLFLYEKII